MKTYILEHAEPNPTMDYANSMVEKVRGSTEIISRGGGSTMDVGKWISRQLNIKHTAVPTTAGTGSEVTKYCVLTVDGKKTTFTDDKFIPDSYSLIPELVASCSDELTMSTGLDAYCQALESYWSKYSTEESRAYSEVAVNLIENSLFNCLTDQTSNKWRMDMLIAANMSGRAINIARTNICHAISYVLTDMYKIPHGIACGMSLRYFARKAATPVDNFLDKFAIPMYKIDPVKVAEEAIKHEKMKDVEFEVTKQDIINSLTI